MEEKRYTILKDGDFTLEKFPEHVLEKNDLEYFLRLEGTARTKLFTKKELNDFVREVEVVAKACNIELPENYFSLTTRNFSDFSPTAPKAEAMKAAVKFFAH